MKGTWWRALPIVALTCLPVLWLSPFPTQDGPAHLYGASLLRHLGEAHYPSITRAFAYSSAATATWPFQKLVSILLGLMAAQSVEKLILLSIVGWFFALFMWGAGGSAASFFPLCALPLFVMSFVLRMGFYSFCLSMPVAIQAVALWAASPTAAGNRRLVLAGCLAALVPLLHVLAAGWALALMGACSLGSAVVRRRLPVRELAILAAASLPLLVLLRGYPVSQTPYTWERFGARIAALTAGEAFVAVGRNALWLSTVPSVLLLAVGILWARDAVRVAGGEHGESWRCIMAVVGALLLALAVPEAEGAGGAYIGVRCTLLFDLLLLFLLRTWRVPARVDAALSVVFLAFSVVHLWTVAALLKPVSAAEAEIRASAGRLDNHTTAMVLVAGAWLDQTTPTLATQVRPLLHAGDLLGIGADRTIWTFYEAQFALFPVTFRQDASPYGALFGDTFFGWGDPGVRWDRVATWQGGVDYVGVWDEGRLLSSAEGARFRAAMCAHYEELYRSVGFPWVIYHRVTVGDGHERRPKICSE
jgi:hypothetical protein